MPGAASQQVLLGYKKEPFSITFTSASTYVAFSSPQSFTDMAIGGPGLIVALISNSAAGTISDVTIGGVSASTGASTTGTSTRVSIWYARIVSGTTATVVVTGTSINRMCVQLVRIQNNASDTPTDSDSPAGGGNSSRTVTIDAPASGGIVAGSEGDENADPAAVTNATKLNEVAGSFDTSTLAGYTTVGSAETGRVITINPCRCICAVAWA